MLTYEISCCVLLRGDRQASLVSAYSAMYHLERGDVSADVNGVPARVGGVRGRALGDRHGEQEGLLSVGVHPLVERLHEVQKYLPVCVTRVHSTRQGFQ